MDDPPRAFVIGCPVAHSRSPLIHGHWLRHHGLPGRYERIEVRPDDVASFVAGLPGSGFRGGNVTIPHKEAVARLVPDLTATARRIGAVNTLLVGPDGRVRGDNTDGLGFMASLDAACGPDWAGGGGAAGAADAALVLGAGGAALAVVAALADRGLGRILVANRDPARADELRRLDPDRVAIVPFDRAADHLPAVRLLVNATSLGMAGQPPLDLDLAGLPAGAIVCDLVYVPLETPLLARARARGLRAVDGLGMLLHQAAPGFEAWFGVRPRVTATLRRLVERDLEGTASHGGPP